MRPRDPSAPATLVLSLSKDGHAHPLPWFDKLTTGVEETAPHPPPSS